VLFKSAELEGARLEENRLSAAAAVALAMVSQLERGAAAPNSGGFLSETTMRPGSVLLGRWIPEPADYAAVHNETVSRGRGKIGHSGDHRSS